MPLVVCTCHCGSTEQLVRSFLHQAGYKDSVSIPVAKGREASRLAIRVLPASDEKTALDNFLQSASKWVVIAGYNPENGAVRWSDLAHRNPKVDVEATLVVENFG